MADAGTTDDGTALDGTTDGGTTDEGRAAPSTRAAPGGGDGRHRVAIEGVSPEIDCGAYPAKRVVGDDVEVEADIFADGHDQLRAVLLHRRRGETHWHEAEMEALVNDRWRGRFPVTELTTYEFTVVAWVDAFRSWHHGFEKKVAAGQDVSVEVLAGAELLDGAAQRAAESGADGDAHRLGELASELRGDHDLQDRAARALSAEVAELADRHPDRRFASRYERELPVVVDHPRARFSTWYELFPRSASPEPGRHGTFADVEARLPYVAEMGFDVLYLPPIHPIGTSFRKGPNNTLEPGPEDPGSPWAIGSPEGGHTEIHPELGTLDDFRRLVDAARHHGIEVALDIAFQCSPDHPWVEKHPEWFRWRPDGTVQYAENPPKKYQDIYPLDFETPAWAELWEELRGVILHWINQGVRVFRVDNPHTKPFAFWEWAIAEIRRDHPDVIFLSEAFTRPRIMHRLAKLGFNQSYTYFTWRTAKWELVEYFNELSQGPGREYFRPNVWPNTPDILHAYLQAGGRPAFVTRLVLAGTLAASYGIYGPAFELGEHRPREEGSEEYLDSEKYQIRHWDLGQPHSLRHIIGIVNRARHQHPALQQDRTLRFHGIDNDQLLCYSKTARLGDDELGDLVVVVVNLDPHHTQSGWTSLDLEAIGLEADESYEVRDLLAGGRYLWQGAHNYVSLDPFVVPAHIFEVRRPGRSERDFDTYQ